MTSVSDIKDITHLAELIFLDTFSHAKEWVQEVGRFLPEDVSKLLVGNKSDLASKKVVAYDVAKVRSPFILFFSRRSIGALFWAGICRSSIHAVLRDFSQRFYQCRAGILDNGEADQGPVKLSLFTFVTPTPTAFIKFGADDHTWSYLTAAARPVALRLMLGGSPAHFFLHSS